MSERRQLLLWAIAAVVATALLVFVLVRQHNQARTHVLSFLTGDPHNGGYLFERKGCSNCHAVNLLAARQGADVPLGVLPKPGLNQLVTSMWNHAPRMWARMQERNILTPSLSERDVSDIFAFLYVAQYSDEPGNSGRGSALFNRKGCIQCHTVNGKGGTRGPDLAKISGVDTPIAWAQTMWNHAPAMHAGMAEIGASWPRFDGAEMNDLLAYVREVCSGPRIERDLLPADPERGRQLFRTKRCLDCHSVQGSGGNLGPELGPQTKLPRTMVQFAGAMWNHSPEMYKAMKQKSLARPQFRGQEMADLMAFLYSLRYFEPTGSRENGEKVFTTRGCARCHGANGKGSALGPRLRRHAQLHSSISIATALWRHGPNMYRTTQKIGLPWPMLEESDIGDLVAFLNAPADEER